MEEVCFRTCLLSCGLPWKTHWVAVSPQLAHWRAACACCRGGISGRREVLSSGLATECPPFLCRAPVSLHLVLLACSARRLEEQIGCFLGMLQWEETHWGSLSSPASHLDLCERACAWERLAGISLNHWGCFPFPQLSFLNIGVQYYWLGHLLSFSSWLL